MRRPLIVGNWKMNGSRTENARLVKDIMTQWVGTHRAEVAICVPFIYIEQVAQLLATHNVVYGAQDMSVHLDGAYTGEISASMLVDYGCDYVIVGHSERRQYHHESNLLVAQKTLAVQQAGLKPIVCVGETLADREAGSTLDIIAEQIAAVKSVIGEASFARTVIAYEPVWAIGTGLTATPEQAQEVHQFIRQQLGETAASVRILYGGSVKPNNAASLFSQADIDGALIGGASLVANDFIEIARAIE